MLVGTYAKVVFGVPITFTFVEVTLVRFGFEVSLSFEGMMNGDIAPSGRLVDVTSSEISCRLP